MTFSEHLAMSARLLGWRLLAALQAARSLVPLWWRAAWSEVRKDLIIELSYRLDFLVNLGIWVLIFLGSVLLAGGGQVTAAQLSFSALGFALTYYTIDLLGNISSDLTEAARTGTLEQTYMSSAPPRLIILAKMVASLALSTLGLALAGLVLLLFTPVRLPFKWEAVPIVVVTWIGLLGFGFIVAGGALLFKQVGPAVGILTRVLFFVNGTFLPLDTLNDPLTVLGRLLPSAQGIVVFRRVLLDGGTLPDVLADGSAVFLVVHSIVLFALGWQIFGWAEALVKQRGSLGQY